MAAAPESAHWRCHPGSSWRIYPQLAARPQPGLAPCISGRFVARSCARLVLRACPLGLPASHAGHGQLFQTLRRGASRVLVLIKLAGLFPTGPFVETSSCFPLLGKLDIRWFPPPP